MRLSRARNVIIGICAVAPWAFAQHEECPRPTAATVDRAPSPSSCLKVVEGTTNPEQIPEAVAFRMFYRAIAQPVNATPEQLDMQRAFVSGATLSESDLQQLSYVMGDYRYGLDSLRKEFRLARQSGAEVDAATVQRLTAE